MRPYRKKRELANWIRRRLGAPVIDQLIDTTQIDDLIDQATDFFGEHAAGIGNEDSVMLICPEPVYYDGTGSPCQPGPTAGRWRKPVTVPTTGSSGTSGTPTPEQCGVFPPSASPCTPCTTGTTGQPCPPSNCGAFNTEHVPEPLPECTNEMPYQVGGECCPEETDCRGPGWCGDGIQPSHCFTETEKGDPDVEGPFWVEGDTTAKPSRQGFVFKSVYDVPTDIIAVHSHLGVGYFGTGQYGAGGEALFSPLHMLMHGGGSWGMQSPTAWTDNRYGYWHGSHGGFVDVVGWEMGMQYLEMFRTLYSIKTNVQLLEVEHKVRISPPPTHKGVLAFGVTRRVPDEAMYEHQWVREYAYALCLVQCGMNGFKYTNLTFPGGGSFNAEGYLSRGDELREKLETQIYEGMYSLPPDFYMG